MLDRQSPEAPPPPGALTATMRAASGSSSRAAAAGLAPKALRVGLVHRGKVIDERVVAAGEHLTIGPNERATFVIQSPLVPPNFRLFEGGAGGFQLHVVPGMSGRIAGRTGTAPIEEPGEQASTAARAIVLEADARGKVCFGEHVVLFQLVTPAPALGKPRLPSHLESGLGEVDWRTSIVAAFSFLFHFGAVGSVYSDWMDPVVDDEVQATQLIESLRELPPPPPLERPKDEPTTAASAAASAAQKPGGPPAGRTATAGSGSGGASRGDARAHQISSQLSALEMQMIVGLGSSAGSATNAVLGPGGDLPLGMLDKAAASSSGVRTGGMAGLDLGGGSGGPLRPGSITRSAVPGDTSMGPVTAGTAVTVRAPVGNVGVSPPIPGGGEVPNAPSVVAGMAAGFRRCYNIGLNREDPTMKGTVRITARIGPNGEVQSASASGGGTLSPTVIGCMRNRVASAQFAPPTGGVGATLVIPISVTPQ
jgi:hypothetical protein